MPACLLILIGLPGSGKTTLARRLCSALTPSYRPVHVEYDAAVDLAEQARLQAAAAAGEDDDGWRAARRELERAVEAAVTGGEMPTSLSGAVRSVLSPIGGLNDARTIAERPIVFIIDDNMYLRSMRYRYFQLARRHQLGFATVLLDVPVEECLRRNAGRPIPVPETAIETMAARLERPDSGRLWEARSVTLTGASSLSERVPVEPEDERASEESGGTAVVREPGGVENTSGGPRSAGSPREDFVQIVTELVAAALRSPVPPLVDNSLESDVSRQVCSTSQLHQLDRQLRRLVGQHAAGCGSRAKAANLARQRLMRRARSGELGLDVEPTEAERFAEASRGLFEAELSVGQA